MKSKSTPLPKKPSLQSLKLEAADLPSSKFSAPQVWDPAPYQIEGAKFLVSRTQAALLLDPGLRKTSMVLAALKTLLKKKLAKKVLVVAPPRVCEGTWPEEVAKWKEFAHLKVVNLHGPKKEQLLDVDADIYLVSYNLLPWLSGAHKVTSALTGKVKVVLDLARLKKLGVDILVCDEISKARNTNSQTFKILKEIRDHFSYIYGMTGSPMPQSLLNLFGVMYIIDGGYSLGAYITHYRSAYFMPSGYGGYDYKLIPGREKDIYERISDFAFRLDAKEYIKLPKLIENIKYVHLPAEARRIYDTMEDEFYVEVAGDPMVAINGGSAYNKCRQIANGGLYKQEQVDETDMTAMKGKREWVDLHHEKAELVADLVEELEGNPTLVVYNYKHDLARLEKALGKDVPRMGGGVTAKAGAEIVRRWNRGEIPVLLVHAQSMSHGLNMQGASAHHIIWHSLTDNYEDYEQLTRRLLRSGNEASHVFNHLLVAKDTVDEITLKRGTKKAANQKEFLTAMNEYTLRRRRQRGRK